jgi:hypothetical protein
VERLRREIYTQGEEVGQGGPFDVGWCLNRPYGRSLGVKELRPVRRGTHSGAEWPTASLVVGQSSRGGGKSWGYRFGELVRNSWSWSLRPSRFRLSRTSIDGGTQNSCFGHRRTRTNEIPPSGPTDSLVLSLQHSSYNYTDELTMCSNVGRTHVAGHFYHPQQSHCHLLP